ncbi:hypothetical protein CR513_47575, partial [Mucuna pruriens]
MSDQAPLFADPKSRKSCLYAICPAASLAFAILFFTSSVFTQENQCGPSGSEALPAGIVSTTSSLEMRPLWEPPIPKRKHHPNIEIEVIDVKFLDSDFMVMLFHYDSIVDEWGDLEWSTRDLGVEHFHPDKYVSIIKREGLEISQPALDPKKSEVHHQITARGRRTTVHRFTRSPSHLPLPVSDSNYGLLMVLRLRRTYKANNDGKGCDRSSTSPPCTGWIEMMAPVFSRSAWRCVWYMIQNDLIHAWGLDMQLGYCAQASQATFWFNSMISGDRTKNVGVVDAEYIVHYNRPTLGGIEKTAPVSSEEKDHRADVRRLSYRELDVFRKRWEKAVEEDECWVDPYQ